MLHLNPNPTKPPKGGKFRHNSMDGIEFEADDFTDLIARLAQHEAYQLLTTEEIRQSVLKQVAIESPWMVVDSGDAIPTEKRSQEMLREWILSLREDGLEYADNSDYIERRAICLACQHNEQETLDEEAKRRVFLLARGYVDRRLGMCHHHHHHNAVACWLKLPNQPGPSNCWRSRSQ